MQRRYDEIDMQTIMAALAYCRVYEMDSIRAALLILAGKVNKVCAENARLRKDVADAKYHIAMLVEENRRLNSENITFAQEILKGGKEANAVHVRGA